MNDHYTRTWYLFGVIPIWRTKRTLSEPELKKRIDALLGEALVGENKFLDKIKNAVLNEINRAWDESGKQSK